MARSWRIMLLAALTLFVGLALWLRGGPAPPPRDASDNPGAPPPATSSNKMIGMSAIGHGGPTAPPATGTATAIQDAGIKARKGNE